MTLPSLQAWTAALASCLALTAAGPSVASPGQRLSERRDVPAFEAIELSGPMSLMLHQSDQQSVEVQADAHVLSLIETKVEQRSGGPALVVQVRRGESLGRSGRVVVHVQVTRLTAIASSGSGSIDVQALTTPELKLSVAGSGDVKMRALATERLRVAVAGSGDIQADGRATELKLSIAGSGDAEMHRLIAQDVRISIAGSGDAQVAADRSLSVSIAGSGDVRYTGQVNDVKTSIAGSGTVRRR